MRAIDGLRNTQGVKVSVLLQYYVADRCLPFRVFRTSIGIMETSKRRFRANENFAYPESAVETASIISSYYRKRAAQSSNERNEWRLVPGNILLELHRVSY